ncbi:MAG: beta-ketoacyl-ACP synthase III [Candidatus Neomarinimicrobiota bacterium]|nr:beta-ketoacyl-ACP synthase III [Candidatus Neomarinimicrobiota bacterium]
MTRRASITAVSHYLPERILTNVELEKTVATNDEWIRSRTGIAERRVVADDEATSDMGIKSAQKIIEKTGVEVDEIDVIIVATVTPDMFFPSTAALVQDAIRAKNAWAFDLNAACSGFIFSLETAAGLIAARKHEKILVIGGDTMTSVLDYRDRASCILFGDGAGAVLMEPSKGDDGIIDSIMFTDGSGGNRLYMPGGGSRHPATRETVDQRLHYLKQDGREVFKSAVRGMTDAAETILLRNGLSGKDLKLFIPHQANKRIIDASAKRLGLTEEQVLINIERVANTTAGTIPIGLSEAVSQERLEEGDLLLLAAFGAGFTWGATLIRWGQCI